MISMTRTLYSSWKEPPTTASSAKLDFFPAFPFESSFLVSLTHILSTLRSRIPGPSETEVAYHKTKELQEIKWEQEEIFTYVDFLADFRGKFHDIRDDRSFENCLDPVSYTASQQLARELLEAGSGGVVYPSLRHKAGTCVACFRPALVSNVRKGPRVSITFKNAFAPPVIQAAK